MIDIKDAREDYRFGIIGDVIWIRPNWNLADEINKTSILPKPTEVMKMKVKQKLE